MVGIFRRASAPDDLGPEPMTIRTLLLLLGAIWAIFFGFLFYMSNDGYDGYATIDGPQSAFSRLLRGAL